MKKFVVISVLSLLISACGGSSSKDGSPKVANPTPKAGATIHQVPSHLQDEVREIKTIKIGNTLLDLSNENPGFITKARTTHTQVRIYNQVYSVLAYIQPTYTPNRLDRFKLITELGKIDPNKRHYSNALLTPFDNIPTTSSATYTGVALSDDLDGRLRLHADFANKMVSGQIDNLRKVSTREEELGFELRATSIRQFSDTPEVHFAGVAARSDGSIRGYAGSFAGPNAEEVIGVIADDKNKVTLEFIGKK